MVSARGLHGSLADTVHCLRMSLDERFLFCLPPRSQRHARVSLSEVSHQRAAERQRPQASGRLAGVLTGTRVEGLVCRGARVVQ